MSKPLAKNQFYTFKQLKTPSHYKSSFSNKNQLLYSRAHEGDIPRHAFPNGHYVYGHIWAVYDNISHVKTHKTHMATLKTVF